MRRFYLLMALLSIPAIIVRFIVGTEMWRALVSAFFGLFFWMLYLVESDK
jgi:hypothetical protein